jgi:hypothetical protein
MEDTAVTKQLVLIAILAFVGLFHASNAVKGQSSNPEVRTFNPATVEVDISGIEPPPPDVDKEMDFSGGGGGPNVDSLPPEPQFKTSPLPIVQPSPRWSRTTLLLGPEAERNFLNACGFKVGVLVAATMNYPSGRQKSIDVTADSRGCIRTPDVAWKVGVELGLYTLTLTDGTNTLTHTWGADYPICPMLRIMGGIDLTQQSDTTYLLAGYPPKQNTTIHIYAIPDDPYENKGPHVATRTIQVDENGAVLIHLKIARSAPFTNVVVVPDPIHIQKPPTATYLTYTMFPDAYPCMVNAPQYAQIVTPDSSPQTLYEQPERSAAISNKIASGEPVEVLEPKVVLENNRVVTWYRIQDNSGKTGWMEGLHLTGIKPRFYAGGTAKFVKELDGKRYDIGLWKSTDSISVNDLVSRPENNAVVTLILELVIKAPNKDLLDDNWWYVRAPDGSMGWVPMALNHWYPQKFLTPLPWKPVDVSAIVVPTPQPIATQVMLTCPRSPKPRLIVGKQGQVTPGDPNALRESPTGPTIGRIPGSAFFDVIGGPQCGDKSRTYWQVNYNGMVGWTAEGEGKIYWLTPVK